MSIVYTVFKSEILKGNTARDLPGGDVRIDLVMSNTTFDTEQDDEFVGDTSTPDFYDGATYARQALTSEAVATDSANDRGEFDADDAQFATLGVGTRQAVAIVVFLFITSDALSPLMCYVDTGGFPFDGNGGNVDVAWNVEGILQTT